MKGVRSKDNCYLWVPRETTYSSTCLIYKEDEVKLQHHKLGHMNLKIKKKIMTEEACRFFNSRTKVMMESINIVVDDLIIQKVIDVHDDVGTSSQRNNDLENEADYESNNEYFYIESPEKSQDIVHDKNSQEVVSEGESVGGEEDDYDNDSMPIEVDFSDKEDKEENVGVKKYQSTNIVNVV